MFKHNWLIIESLADKWTLWLRTELVSDTANPNFDALAAVESRMKFICDGTYDECVAACSRIKAAPVIRKSETEEEQIQC